MTKQYIAAIASINEQAKKEKSATAFFKKFITKDHVVATSPDGEESVDVNANGIIPPGWKTSEYKEE